MLLIEWIKLVYGMHGQSQFARDIGVHKNSVSGWVRDGWIIVDGVLYSPRRGGKTIQEMVEEKSK